MIDFTIFTFVALSSILSTLIFYKFKVPSVIFLMFFGMILGPYGFRIVSKSEIIEIFSGIGSILLLFIIGLEFNIEKIREVFSKSLLIFLFESFFIFFSVYIFLSFFNFGVSERILISLTCMMTSTAVTFKLLSELGLERKREKTFILSVSILEDIAAIFLLSFISSLNFANFVNIETLIFSLVKSIFLILLLILIFPRFLKPIFSSIPQSDENILMLSLFFLSIFLWLSNIIGISPSLGAFLAGSILSLLLSENALKIIEKSGLIFISFFFFSFGFYLDWKAVVQNINLLFLLSFIYIFSKSLAIFFGFRIVGFSIKSSVFSSVSMIPLGEMAILLASYGLKLGLISSGIFGVISSLAVITSLISYFLIKNYESISNLIEKIHFISFKVPKMSFDFLNNVKKEGFENFISSIIFLSLLFYINLPIHQKDFITLFISIFCLSFISLSFFKISNRFLSLSLFLMYFEKSRRELKVLKEVIMLFILILIIFIYSVFIQEVTKIILLPVLIIIILIAIFRNLKMGPVGYYFKH